MAIKWQSTGLYEHPEKHQAGIYGNVVQHDSGIYSLKVGGSMMSCPQNWAATIQTEETGQTSAMIIRKVPEDVRRAFKVRCAQEGVSIQAKIVELMRAWAGGEK